MNRIPNSCFLTAPTANISPMFWSQDPFTLLKIIKHLKVILLCGLFLPIFIALQIKTEKYTKHEHTFHRPTKRWHRQPSCSLWKALPRTERRKNENGKARPFPYNLLRYLFHTVSYLVTIFSVSAWFRGCTQYILLPAFVFSTKSDHRFYSNKSAFLGYVKVMKS